MVEELTKQAYGGDHACRKSLRSLRVTLQGMLAPSEPEISGISPRLLIADA